MDNYGCFLKMVIVLSMIYLGFAFSMGKAAKFISTRLSACPEAPRHGYYALKNPFRNKGTSFTAKARDELGIRGLIPAGEPQSLELKVKNAMEQLAKKATPLDKYIFLHTIQDSDETLFYSILINHTKETMPYVYTPTVGQACQEWSHIYRHTPRGFYVSLKDKGKIRQMMDNLPVTDVKVIVVTDGERILGLGDLGVNGMGIPIGKLALYTACAGIDPHQVLPVHIDVGTNTKEILEDPIYMGLRQERDRTVKYDELIEEFFTAAQDKYGKNVLIQFEDFGNLNAFRLLENYRNKANCFNDDIQGTASVVLGGLLASLPMVNKKDLSNHRYLFFGAGEAGIGIAELIASAIQQQTGGTLQQAREHCWFVDSKGLITSDRLKNGGKLEEHKLHYAHDVSKLIKDADVTHNKGGSLLDAVHLIQPTALIGVSAQGGAFHQDVCEAMTKYNSDHGPVIYALSNPTSKAECTAKDAYTWTKGKCVFASGSPFDPVTLNGKQYVPGQGNNAYIFPGVGLGAIASGAKTLTDNDFYVAASTLASLVPADRRAQGCCYPSLDNIRTVSAHIAAAVAKNVFDTNRASISRPSGTDTKEGMLQYCENMMYEPKY